MDSVEHYLFQMIVQVLYPRIIVIIIVLKLSAHIVLYWWQQYCTLWKWDGQCLHVKTQAYWYPFTTEDLRWGFMSRMLVAHCGSVKKC